jgi:aminoglycoside phosphotransferase (APT) family kinase protein
VTDADLLETLRLAVGDDSLAYAEPPKVLAGGFYAEMIRFRLASPALPPELDRDLVARIVPSADAGAWESTIQREVADQGFPTPKVRLTVRPELASGAPTPLGRFVTVMDLVDGEPPMDGLGFGTIATQIPRLVRGLPDDLATMAARLHRLDAAPLAAELDALEGGLPRTTEAFVEWQGDLAAEHGRQDLVAAAERLLASVPRAPVTVIAHGDLHPFNLLVTQSGPVLIDWTVARVAHPAFTLGFTELMLSNPPVPLPPAAAAFFRRIGRGMAKRFLRTYRALTPDRPHDLDPMSMQWHRNVHALRILVELAGWDAAGTRPASGHPWLILEQPARRELGLDDG